MHPDHYRDMIVRAVKDGNEDLLQSVGQRMAAAEVAHSILRAKGYGVNGTLIDDTARQVPDKKDGT